MLHTVAATILTLIQVGWLVRGYCRFIEKHKEQKANVVTLLNGEK